MEDKNRRFFSTMLWMGLLLLTWQWWVAPRLAPPPKPPAPEQPAVADNDHKRPRQARGAGEPNKPAVEQKKHPIREIELGADDPASGYRMVAKLTSAGAAIREIRLNDPRYRELHEPHAPLKVVGNNTSPENSLQLTIPDFGIDLDEASWEVVGDGPAQGPRQSVTFRQVSPDGALEVLKQFSLLRLDPELKEPTETASPREADAYALRFETTIRNLSPDKQTVKYVLQGPVGLPLENVDNTSKYRDVVVGFVNDGGSVSTQWLNAKTIADGKTETWYKPVQFVGVDVQYFAGLLIPQGKQWEDSYLHAVTQKVVGKAEAEKSDLTVQLSSVDLKLDPSPHPAGKAENGKDANANQGNGKEANGKAGAGQAGEKAGALRSEVTHRYRFYAGPKRDEFLDPFAASSIIDYGRFGFIGRPMLAMLQTFYQIFHSYGIAIICLTVVVRSCLFPLSIRQAKNAAKMQALQPEMAVLKEKYGKDQQKLGLEMMALYRRHGTSPMAMFGGCLLMFLQLPIFISLYNALSLAVDLRMAKFLWIDNLAAPDALFQLGFRMPLLGWTEFNLLPIITIALFVAQQKMFMPPPASEEQAMQQKMMNFMMIFMGVMFYRVPAGLCVYFIASSLWGMAERKLLPKTTGAPVAVPVPAGDATPDKPRLPATNAPASSDGEGGSWWERLLKAAEKEAAARRQQGSSKKKS